MSKLYVADLPEQIRARAAYMGINSMRALSSKTGITWFRLRTCFDNPSCFTLQDLEILSDVLKHQFVKVS